MQIFVANKHFIQINTFFQHFVCYEIGKKNVLYTVADPGTGQRGPFLPQLWLYHAFCLRSELTSCSVQASAGALHEHKDLSLPADQDGIWLEALLSCGTRAWG